MKADTAEVRPPPVAAGPSVAVAEEGNQKRLLQEVPAKDLKKAKAAMKGGMFKKAGGGKALYEAATAGNEAMVRALIAVGAELNWKNPKVSE